MSIMKVPCEVYSRIVGYHRPTSRWNKGKAKEFEDRKVFNSELTSGD